MFFLLFINFICIVFIFFIYIRNLFLHFYCSGQCVASSGGMVFMMWKEPAPDGLAL